MKDDPWIRYSSLIITLFGIQSKCRRRRKDDVEFRQRVMMKEVVCFIMIVHNTGSL
jgi:hypothetical protein